jgi:hypothetical protein
LTQACSCHEGKSTNGNLRRAAAAGAH